MELNEIIYAELIKSGMSQHDTFEWSQRIAQVLSSAGSRLSPPAPELMGIGEQQITGEYWEFGNIYVCEYGKVPSAIDYFRKGVEVQLSHDRATIKKAGLTLDEFYKKYLPEDDKKYPVTMRVSQEEHDLILNHRGISGRPSPRGKEGRN